MILTESIEEIKQKANLVRIAESVVKNFKKSGSTYIGSCPFHNDSTPSFHVYPKDNKYHCFGCEADGDVLDFIQKTQNKTLVEAARTLAVDYNIELQYSRPVKDYVRPVLSSRKLSETFLDGFVRQRKVKAQTIEKFGITEATEFMPKAGKEIQVLCFNYFRKGELINVKYRGANKDFKMAKDAELIFYNLDSIENAREVVIVEGEIDALSVDQAGIPAVISVPNGANTGKMEYLDNCWSELKDKEKVVIMTDNDEPGRKVRDELARRIGYDKCWMVTYPPDCKDANEVLISKGEDAIREMYINAKPWPIYGVLEMDDLIDDVIDFYHAGYPKGVGIGSPELDSLITYMPGQFTTVTGVPGSGKSEFIDWICVRLAQRHEWPFGVVSFENQPSSIHVTKLIEKHAGRSFAFRYNLQNRLSDSDLEYGIDFVSRKFFFVNINEVEITIDGILSKLKELVGKKGIKGAIIDPWNYIEHQMPHGMNETQYISACLTKIKVFCKQTGVHVFLVAHPTKVKKDPNGKYEIPNLYMIAGSAHFFNKTDNGITVYRNAENNVVDVYVQKVRYSWLGRVGFCSFAFDTETRQYKSIEGGPAADNSDDPNLY